MTSDSRLADRVCSFILRAKLAIFSFVLVSTLDPSFSLAQSGVSIDGTPGRTNWADVVEVNFPFFSSVVDARSGEGRWPTNNLTPRGLILNLGHDCWACFDTDLLRVSAVWTGKGLSPVSMSQGSYQIAGVKVPEGQDTLPQILGLPWMMNGIYPGWQSGETVSLIDPRDPTPDPREVGRGPLATSLGQFKSIRWERLGIRMEYRVAGTSVHEWITTEVTRKQLAIQRRFSMDPVPQSLWLILGRSFTTNAIQSRLAIPGGFAGGKTRVELVEQRDGVLTVHIPSSKKPVEFAVAMSLVTPPTHRKVVQKKALEDPHPQLWPQIVTTRGTLSISNDAYVVDNIPLPLDNPWKRNVRVADLGFFKDGRAAAVTFDGDVWIVTGLRNELENISWRRFASGLHEPLGLCVRDDEVFVFDRNGIWKLRDSDGNGEADVYELFSNAFAQTAETREFAAGLRSAPDGSRS